MKNTNLLTEFYNVGNFPSQSALSRSPSRPLFTNPAFSCDDTHKKLGTEQEPANGAYRNQSQCGSVQELKTSFLHGVLLVIS